MESPENLTPLSPVKGPDQKKHYEQLLVEQIESIPQWRQLQEREQIPEVEHFMNAIGRLYLDYFQSHLEEAKDCALKYKSLLKTSESPLMCSYVIDNDHRLRSADEYDDPWETACWVRTNIEAFNLLFGEVFELNPEGIDAYMKDRKGTAENDREAIPQHVPSSHWWWFVKFGSY